MKLSPSESQLIFEALVDAYNYETLERMVKFKLGEQLSRIASNQNDIDDVVFKLVNWAEKNDKVLDLVKGAKEKRPNHSKIKQISDQILNNYYNTSRQPINQNKQHELEFLRKTNKFYSIKQIGEGNIAKIFKATDKHMDRIVSIKILRHELNHNKKWIKAFKKSARRAVRISDIPYFLTIYDLYLEDDSYPYYVRQYIEGHDSGQDLREFLNQWVENYDEGLALEHIKKIITQIAEALIQAHEKYPDSYSYTDIKPSNILITHDFDVFLSSFNICAGFQPRKVLEQLKSSQKLEPTISKEEKSYLLPDHFFKVEALSHLNHQYESSDQYLLGLLTYELLLGQIPPTLKNLENLRDKPKPSDIFNQIDSIPRSDCPEILKTIILKMTSIDPRKRYKEFSQAANVLINLDINLTIVKDSYRRCIGSPWFSNEQFFKIFLSKLKPLSEKAYQKLNFQQRDHQEKHVNSLKKSILFLFAYFEQNERFYKNTGQPEEPNILTDTANSHSHRIHNISEDLYKPFGEALIDTIAEFDQKFDEHPHLRQMWQDIYDSAVEYMISKY